MLLRAAHKLLRKAQSPQNGGALVYRFGSSLAEPLTDDCMTEGFAKSSISENSKKLLIGGQFVESVSGKSFPVIDPRTEETIAYVAEGDKADIDKAVAAARKAFDFGAWPRMGGKERGRLMHKWADLIDQHVHKLAALETLNNGKPIFFSRNVDTPLAASHYRYFAGWADKIHGKHINVQGGFNAYTLHEPIGVVGCIIPWNFPMLMQAWKLAPALAAGNTVVLKTAEQTPLTAVLIAELALEAGFPEGVINVVSGYGNTAGQALAEHMDVDKVAFTGSTEVGRKVMAAAAGSNLKAVSLELGGKSPAIVCPDVDVDKVIEDTHFALFFNQGQCCCAASRLYVHDDIYDEFVEKAAARANSRTVGDPFGDVEQGPQISQEQFDKVMSYIDHGKASGATLLAGGNRVGVKGYYVQPTVFAVDDEMTIAKEEIFGPVMSIMRWSDPDEMIRRANNTQYGLAAGVWTDNIHMSNKFARGLRAGTVWINCFNNFDDALPFGGYKMSGIGRDKGEYALANYTQVKAICEKMDDDTVRY